MPSIYQQTCTGESCKQSILDVLWQSAHVGGRGVAVAGLPLLRAHGQPTNRDVTWAWRALDGDVSQQHDKLGYDIDMAVANAHPYEAKHTRTPTAGGPTRWAPCGNRLQRPTSAMIAYD